jgi:hypothetical protein
LGKGTTQQVSSTATYGWFFEPRLTLSERFFLTPGFRLDGGNANGGNASVSGLPSKLSFASLFPKINFSWVAVDRQDGDAAPLFGVLTLLRPRLALGSAGVQPTPGDRLRLLGLASSCVATSGSCIGTGDTLGIATLGNTQLRPEKSFEVEGGVDAALWHNRASVEVTYAQKMQHDAIIRVPVAPSVLGSGFASINLNVGKIRNRNLELSGSVTPVENTLARWTVSGNLTHNDQTVLRLDQASTAFYQNGQGINGEIGCFMCGILGSRISVGYPLFGRWARPILGYGDANGDGIIQASEIRLGDTAVYLGREDPGYTAGVATDLTLFQGRLSVHANFAHQSAYTQLNHAAGGTTNAVGTFLSAANDVDATFGQQANYVAAVSGLTPIGLAQTVHLWRFQSMSVNYTVPAAVARYFRARWMSMALQGSNLALWTNYRGKDPNVNAFPNSNVIADGGQIVQPRAWSLMFTLGN